VAVPPELAKGFANLNTPADRERSASILREGVE
jgi:hypothetical protein